MDWAQCFVHHPERKLQSIQLDRIIFVHFCVIVSSHKCTVDRVRTGHGKPGKSWNFIISFSRPGKSWNLGLGHGKSWKISTLYMSERQ